MTACSRPEPILDRPGDGDHHSPGRARADHLERNPLSGQDLPEVSAVGGIDVEAFRCRADDRAVQREQQDIADDQEAARGGPAAATRRCASHRPGPAIPPRSIRSAGFRGCRYSRRPRLPSSRASLRARSRASARSLRHWLQRPIPIRAVNGTDGGDHQPQQLRSNTAKQHRVALCPRPSCCERILLSGIIRQSHLQWHPVELTSYSPDGRARLDRRKNIVRLNRGLRYRARDRTNTR